MNILIKKNFGHEIMACAFAKAYNATVLIAPEKGKQEEYNAEAVQIMSIMKTFYSNMDIVPFTGKDKTEVRDIIDELISGLLPDEAWGDFARYKFDKPNMEGLPTFSIKDGVLIVTGKLISDEKMGKTAKDQSLPSFVFNFLKNENLILGQHFAKADEKDRQLVQFYVDAFNAYVPGLTENEQLYGIRGVDHDQYFNMYASLKAAVGVAGTHTWILLTMFPEIPQIILYTKGIENWGIIAEEHRKAGYNIHAIAFDNETDMEELSKEIEAKYAEIMSINEEI